VAFSTTMYNFVNKFLCSLAVCAAFVWIVCIVAPSLCVLCDRGRGAFALCSRLEKGE